jgi:hypothetical protein
MENFDLIKYLAESKLLKENKNEAFTGLISEKALKDTNELEAYKQFIISDPEAGLDGIIAQQAEEGENLWGEPFNADGYEELKNSINSSTTQEEVDEIVENYLYENVYEKDYEVKDQFKYWYKTFYKNLMKNS